MNNDEPDFEFLGSYNDEPPTDDFKPFKCRIEPTENRSIESKPSNVYLPVILENMPTQLHNIKNWVLWRPEPRKNSDKIAKMPYTIHGYHASTKNPATWSSFDSVCDVLRKNDKYSGLGFVLKTKIDGHDIVGIDVDHPFDSEIATEFRSRFSNTYIEKSPSGKLRVFCTGVIPRSGKGVNDQKIEVYNHTSSRYLTITGHRLNHCNITLQQDALNWLFEAYFTPKYSEQQLQIKTQPNANHAVLGMGFSANSGQEHSGQVQGSKYSGGGCQSTQPVQSNENNSYLDKWSDQQVIDAIKRSKKCNDFNTLFSGGSILGNESQDCMKLAGNIAFYAGSSIGSGPEQINRIISQSQRPNVLNGKWQRIGMDCSQKAIANAKVVYTPKPKPKPNLEPKPELKVSFNYVDDVGFKRDIKKLVTSDCNVTDVIAQLQEKHPNVEIGQIIILVKRQLNKTLEEEAKKLQQGITGRVISDVSELKDVIEHLKSGASESDDDSSWGKLENDAIESLATIGCDAHSVEIIVSQLMQKYPEYTGFDIHGCVEHHAEKAREQKIAQRIAKDEKWAEFEKVVKPIAVVGCDLDAVISQLMQKYPDYTYTDIKACVEYHVNKCKESIPKQFFLMFRYRLTNNSKKFEGCVEKLKDITRDIDSTLAEFEDFYRAKLEKYSQKLVIPDNMIIHESNSRYTSIPTANEGDTMIVKAAMGTGKTYYLENAIKGFRKQGFSVVYLTHRISLASSGAKRLNLDFYQDKIDTEGVSIVVNSIPKSDMSPDVVIIDEVDQVLKHITGGACANGEEVLKTLKEWVSNAIICIAMSADIDDLTVNFIKHCRPGKIDFYLNSFKPREGQEIQVCDEVVTFYDQLFHLFAKEDDQKGCVVICTNSKNQSKKIYEYVKSFFPSKSGVCINSDNTENEDIQNLIRNIDTHIDNLDYLVFSPSIGSGVSIETPKVKAVFGYFTSQTMGTVGISSSTSQDAWQQIGRVRKIDVPTYVYVDSRLNLDLPITEDEIHEIIKDRVDAVCVEIEKADQPDWTKSKIVSRVTNHVFTEYERLCISVKIDANILNRDFGNYFLVQGVMAGISFSTVEPPNEGCAKSIKESVGMISEKVKITQESEIFNARDITDTEVHDLIESSKNGSKLSQDDQLAITKHLIAKEFDVPQIPTDTTAQDYEEKLKQYNESLKDAISLDDNGKGRKIIKRIRATQMPIQDVGKDDVFTLNEYLKQGKLVKVYDKKLALLDREMVVRLFKATGVYVTQDGQVQYDRERCWNNDDPDVVEFVAWCKKSGIIPKKYKGFNCQFVGQLLEGLGITTTHFKRGSSRFYRITEGKPGSDGKLPSFTVNAGHHFGLKKTGHPCPFNIYSVGGKGVPVETPIDMPVDAQKSTENLEVLKGAENPPNVMIDDCDVCCNEEITPASIENHNKPHKVDSPQNLWRGFDSDEPFLYQMTRHAQVEAITPQQVLGIVETGLERKVFDHLRRYGACQLKTVAKKMNKNKQAIRQVVQNSTLVEYRKGVDECGAWESLLPNEIDYPARFVVFIESQEKVENDDVFVLLEQCEAYIRQHDQEYLKEWLDFFSRVVRFYHVDIPLLTSLRDACRFRDTENAIWV